MYTIIHSAVSFLHMLISLLIPPHRKIKVYQHKWAAWVAKKATLDIGKDYEVVFDPDDKHITSVVTISTEREASPIKATSLAMKKIDQQQSADYEKVDVPVVRDTKSTVHEYEQIAPLQPWEKGTRRNQQTGTANDMTERPRVEEWRGGDTSGQNVENESIMPQQIWPM